MKKTSVKPKLIFFQYKYDAVVPEFLLTHKIEHVKCLSHFFNVVVISEDCDYQQVCEKYEPDVALFETGLQLTNVRQPAVINAKTNNQIPKIAFMNADPWGGTTSKVVSDLDRWDIKVLFSNSVTAAEHMQGIAENMFVWPNFIDPQVFRDYGLAKNIPVVLTGSVDPQYPWRYKVYNLLADNFPSLVCPHHGYSSRSGKERMLIGENYARVLNTAWFVPTCGTVAKEVVRKHLEIPGSKACLLTERSEALIAAGFVDFENCVFVDEHDVLDKVSYLFENQEKLNEIINSGFKLIHKKHSISNRDQIFQWFIIQKNLKDNYNVRQHNPYEPFRVGTYKIDNQASYIVCNGLHLQYIKEAKNLLETKNFEDAEKKFLASLNYMPNLIEARLGLTICNLFNGKPKAAISWLLPIIKETIFENDSTPDPIHWSYLIICLLCLNKRIQAFKRAKQYPFLRHPELDRIRYIIDLLNGIQTAPFSHSNHNINYRSIHQFPTKDFSQWLESLCEILNACSQNTLLNLILTDVYANQKIKQGYGDLITDKESPVNDAISKFVDSITSSVTVHIPNVKRLYGIDNPMLWERIKEYFFKNFNRATKYLTIFNSISSDELLSLKEEISHALKDVWCNSILIIGNIQSEPLISVLINILQSKNEIISFHFISTYYPESNSSQSITDSRRKQHYYYKDGIDHQINKVIENDITNKKFDTVILAADLTDSKNSGLKYIENNLNKFNLIIISKTNTPNNFLLKLDQIQNADYNLIFQNYNFYSGCAIFQKVF